MKRRRKRKRQQIRETKQPRLQREQLQVRGSNGTSHSCSSVLESDFNQIPLFVYQKKPKKLRRMRRMELVQEVTI